MRLGYGREGKCFEFGGGVARGCFVTSEREMIVDLLHVYLDPVSPETNTWERDRNTNISI